ncbi:MarR family transcriptional regulator [Niveispirillum sp.]|uniref:MarR family winged helix-turn-helix transcriptional regulator n=1 Tax=Niveispirillum sp. TaxID=1917217 RepID=UPI001B7A7792|nr:MarR family transcriptional regulator [Niveispirillum sp.]MBP7336208.1 winged helix DNA-binding protein [Niveispirillum sp.]
MAASSNCMMPLETSVPEGRMHDLPRLLERLHRRFLDIVRLELERLNSSHVTPVQGLMLLTIGEGNLTISELIERGYYLGASAATNLKALVIAGLVEAPGEGDRRTAKLRLTPDGYRLCLDLRRLEARHIDDVYSGAAGNTGLQAAYGFLRRLEQAWADVIRADAIDGT